MENLLPGFTQWIAMGGYGAFIWPAYAAAGAVLGGLAWQSWRANRASEASLARLQLRADNGGGRGR